jgi:hypothetical protein
MIKALLLWVAIAPAASAETARVLSGEHGDFTRLVVELPAGGDWTLGRTPQGYAFAATADVQPGYDLSMVWQRIPRTRLQDLSVDPQTGSLGLELGCDCHIFPFEYQPGIVVLDIKPGPAPAGSAFEAAVVPAPAAEGTEAGAEGAGSYDWLAARRSGKAGPAMALALPLPTGPVSLEPLRDALLEDLARGAADGIVDMHLPGARRAKPGSPTLADQAALPWSNIRIGEAPGLVVTDPSALVQGSEPMPGCADPALLDVPTWNDSLPPPELLAATRAGLYGEFDAPDPDAIRRSIRGLLYLGFGAEAGRQADLLPPQTEDAGLPFYRSMALLVDGESDPQTPFAGMLDCDGPAALWAALAHDRLPTGRGVNRDAILQAFVALPAHLRRHLGAALAEKFLARDDDDAARMIRDAMARAPGTSAAAVALLDAKADLQDGNAEAARAQAEAAVALGGDQVGGLIAVVEAHFATLEPMPTETTEEVLALQGEVENTEAGPAFARAVVLALALSGQTKAAFEQAAATGDVLADLWRVALSRATDDMFLVQAVLPTEAAPPQVAPDVRLGIAERLLALGFPDAAQHWIGPLGPADAPDQRLVAATAVFRSGDARSAVRLLDGLSAPEAAALRAQALLQLGDLASAEAALTGAGKADEAARLDLWQGNWAQLDPAWPNPWLQAAELVGPGTRGEASGILQRGGQVVEASVASRAAIEALLASVASPTGD